MNAHDGQRTDIILQKSSTTILRNSLSLPWILSSTIGWLISNPEDPPVSLPFQCWYNNNTTMPGFFSGFWRLNSGILKVLYQKTSPRKIILDFASAWKSGLSLIHKHEDTGERHLLG